MPPPVPPTELVPSERAVVLLSCALSALGSGLLVATHALWPDLRSPARRLLLFLSLADLLSAASYFYGVLQDFAGPSWDCVLQGALSSFANTSSFFWTVAIALYLYLSIVRAAREPRTGRLLWAFHVVRCVAAAPLPLESPTRTWALLAASVALAPFWRPRLGRTPGRGPRGSCLLMFRGSRGASGKMRAERCTCPEHQCRGRPFVPALARTSRRGGGSELGSHNLEAPGEMARTPYAFCLLLPCVLAVSTAHGEKLLVPRLRDELGAAPAWRGGLLPVAPCVTVGVMHSATPGLAARGQMHCRSCITEYRLHDFVFVHL